jgi:hypothetical protein
LRHIVQNVLFTALVLRAAGIGADGNDTASKIKVAIEKLTKQGRAV